MSAARLIRLVLIVTVVAVIAAPATRTFGQAATTTAQTGAAAPTNDAPNPYQNIEGWAKLPEGRTWGSTSAVDVDKDGKSIWVAERCQANSCLDRTAGKMSDLPTVMKFDANGKLLQSFAAGMMVFPHGIHVDRDGNVWVTDGQDNGPVPARGAGAGGGRGRGEPGATPPAAGTTAPATTTGAAPAQAGGGRGPAGPPAGATLGNQVFKFSPDGKLLLTLGKAGGAAAPDYFYQPNDIQTAPNGDIFVAEGHGRGNNRILKFDKTGKFIKEWGKLGTGPGEFDQPHALAMDSRGRLFVGDRNNNRIQIFDQNGTFIEEWTQYSRPSGVFIDKNDMIYVADSESETVARNHNGWKRGIRIGRVKDGKEGKIIAFIPDPETRSRAADNFFGTSAAEGVAVDAQGNIYGAEVGPKRLMRYVKK
jgi:sugar lactone lactonase YvrE